MDHFDKHQFDIALSSSALQWSSDISKVLKKMIKISQDQAVAIFCEGTFELIRKQANIQNFLPNSESLSLLLKDCGFAKIYTNRYKLHFANNSELFRYIKRSGISGGKKQLNYKDTKNLIASYPVDYLEFEVLFGFSSQ